MCRTKCVVNIGEIHYHKENKTNVGKQIEFSAESNQFEKKIKKGVRVAHAQWKLTPLVASPDVQVKIRSVVDYGSPCMGFDSLFY